MVRFTRLGGAALLVASGAVLFAASWQRWGPACPIGDGFSDSCAAASDHAHEFLFPTEPWAPLGDSAVLGGLSLLLLALAMPLVVLAVARRPGWLMAVTLVVATVAQLVAGASVLASGLAGHLVDPPRAGLALSLWLYVPVAMWIGLAVVGRGWSRAAAALLVVASPLVAVMSYGVGPFDAQPWFEGISAVFLILAAAGLARPAVRRGAGPATTEDRDPVLLAG